MVLDLYSARTSYLLYFAMLCLRKASLKRSPDRHRNEVAASVSCSFSIIMLGVETITCRSTEKRFVVLFDFSRTCNSVRTNENYNFICHFSNCTKAKRRLYSR